MSLTDVILGAVIGAFIIGFGYAGYTAIKFLINRNKIYMEIDMNDGRKLLPLMKPGQDGKLRTNWGTFFTLPDAFTIHKKKRCFRYKEGNPYPYRYGFKIIRDIFDIPPNADGDGRFPKIRYERFDEANVIPPRAVKTFFDTHDYRDAYAGHGSLIFMILIAVAALAIGVAIGGRM